MSFSTPVSSPVSRLRRSALFLPAHRPRMVDKARAAGCDVVILDLEDAVAVPDKGDARAAASREVSAGGFGPREAAVRVNGVDTPWHGEDVAAVIGCRPDVLVVPKVESADRLRQVCERLDEADTSTRVWPMIETPVGVCRAAAVAAAHPRVDALLVGTNDLAKELRVRRTVERAALQTALQLCVVAARAAGIDALDGVFDDTRDAAGFAVQCRQGRDLGFDGKTLIHPGQIEAANLAFAPDDDAVADAAAVVQAWEDHLGSGGGGVAVLEGRMIEELHVDESRRVLALAHEVRRRQATSG